MTPDQEEISQNKADTTEEKNKSTGHESTRYQSSTKRIARNTLMLYFRQILIMLVSLYTVRVVLNTLGAEDYGIYNVVAGVVTMFSFLSGAMATASQRYFAFEMGKGNEEGLQKIFSVTMTIYVLLALIIMLLAETVGLWFVNTKLVIPTERMVAARWIYRFAILSFMVTLLTTPYMASIIAHENMNVYAYVSIVEVALKLGVVFLLQVLPYDKLIVYGGLLLFVACINTGLYRGYCKKHYLECRFRLVWDKVLFKEMVSYSGWNLFGASVGVVKNQIINILLNIFFGPLVNAARGIASQVNSAVVSFSQSFSTAMRPQIIKNYASEKYKETIQLVFRGCKGTFFLMYLFSLPLMIEMPYVLKLWLKEPPEMAVLFTRLALLDALIDSISYPIMTLAQATGKIKLYQGVVGGILLLNLPISYCALKLGAPAYAVMVIAVLVTFVAFVSRLFIVKLLARFSIKDFLCRVVFPVVIVALLASVLPTMISQNLNTGFVRLVFTTVVSCFSLCLLFFFLGLSGSERKVFLNSARKKLHA